MSNFVEKLQVFLESRKIFKNWYIFPKIYFRLSKKKFSIFETKSGMKIMIRTDSTDLMALTNVWMINEYNIDDYGITENDTVIDIGAHIGLFSLRVSNFCTKGKIFSYEPIKDNFECLISNLKLNIKEHGIRNSLLLAPMPTASTSQILGNNECFEAFTSNLYTRRTLSGEFVILNKHLLKDLIEANLWSLALKDKILEGKGSIQNIDEIPEKIRMLYRTTWEIKQKVLLDLSIATPKKADVLTARRGI